MKDQAEASHEGLGWSNDPTRVAEDTYFISKISNVTAFDTSEGLVLIDSGMAGGSRFNAAPEMASQLREFTDAPIHTAIFTHGHIDHVHGLQHFLTDTQDDPRVIAQAGIERHFDRYERTVGLNETISARQIGGMVDLTQEIVDGETPYRTPDIPPDTLFDDEMVIQVGQVTFRLYHARGETDHQCWVYCPERDVVCSSDLIIRHAPNAGNPQKPQRYPEDWATALREMAAKHPRHLCPGHGAAVVDSPDEIQRVLNDTAAYLESIVNQTLDQLNDGAPPTRGRRNNH